MKSLATLTRVEAVLLAREPAAVAFTLLLPLILLVLNGSTGNAPNPTFGGAGTIDVLLAGYLVYVMATSAIMQMPETLADYRDRGILRRMRITPLKPWQILGSHALTHAAMIAAGAALLITVGFVAYDLNLPASITATLLAMVVSAGAMLGFGFLLGALLPSVRTTQAVAAAVYFPAIFVSGALFPTEVLPTFAQRIGDVLPMTYAVRIIREAWTVGTIDWVALAVLAGTTVVATTVAITKFRWEAR
jgi:ABC-2 type transport system permease protein